MIRRKSIYCSSLGLFKLNFTISQVLLHKLLLLKIDSTFLLEKSLKLYLNLYELRDSPKVHSTAGSAGIHLQR